MNKNHPDNLLTSQLIEQYFQLSSIINNSEQFLLLINRNYEIVICNCFVQQMVKERIGIDMKPGDDFFCMVEPNQKLRVKDFCDRALNGEKVEFEYRIALEENNTLYFHNTYKPAINREGDITGVIVIAKDVTENQKNYEAIIKSEQRWRFALEGSNQGVWDWNIETGELYFSPSWRKMLGYNPNEIADKFSEWERLIHPDDRLTMSAHIEKHLHSGKPYYEAEYRLKAKDGTYRWISGRGMISDHLPGSRPSRMIGTHTDITERKKIEENYKLLFYNNPMPMWTYDRDTLKFLNVNNAAVVHYGYSREEFLKMTILDIRPTEDIEKTRAAVKNKESNGCLEQATWRHKKKNGDIIIVNLASQIVDEGTSRHTLVIAENITEKNKAESNLKASEKRYRTLFKTNPLPCFIYETGTLRFLEVNDAAIRHFGYSGEEFLQKTLLDIHLPEHYELLRNSIRKNETQEIARVTGWRLLTKTGEEIICEISASSFEYNGVTARLVVVNDITEKVKIEEAIKETNKRFQFVAQATSDIIWDWNFQSNEILLSDNYYKLLGWEMPGTRTMHLDNAIERVHPDDRQRVASSLEATLSDLGQTIWEEEFKYLKADGSFIYVIDRGFISRDETGQAVRMVGALQDISERKYQEELQSLELRVFEASAVPGIPFHSVLKTLINGFDDLHHGMQASICLLGITEEVEILAPKLSKEHARQLRYFIEKQRNKWLLAQEAQKSIIVSSVDSEDWKYGADAAIAYNWKACWSVPVYHHSGELLAFVNVFLDQFRSPTEQEHNTLSRMRNLLRILVVNHVSLEQMRISNERYDNMLKATHDLVWDWNLETGNFYRNSEGLRKVYGIDDEKSIQNVYSWMERIHPADHIKVQRVINDILHATDEDTFDVEYRFKRDDGEYSFIYDRGVIVRNKEGKPLRMIGAAQNVTDRKKLEQELLEQELDKQKFISQATIDTQEGERREIGKELHDNVNQVLTTTKLYLDLSLSSPELKDELIKKSSKNIIYVINEIRQLSRSLMDPSIGDLGLLDSINDLVENINTTRKLHVSLSASCHLEEHLNESQKLMIFRILQEAMNNTIKYAQATSVQLSLRIVAGNLELSIVDDGKGFEIETVKKGAGLKNIQNRVYLTGGKLLIDSAPGKGCKIIINFPINHIKSN